ncbi:hypothetical protein L218DRAFT_950247 [Marasmius fiardii PR-910]|nr:hypothetical protein L218DRAFT_950247 [Marasmius fiardii PR-910]
MAPDYAPKLGAGLSLLNLFGLNSTSGRVFAAFILMLVLGSLLVHFRYPCRSATSLMKVVDQATILFDKCLAVRAFNEEEYGRFTILLHRVTARASQIAARVHPDSTGRNIHREYLEWASFLCERLKNTVECHRQVQALIRDLEVCLLRSSHSRAEYELETRRMNLPQALNGSNSEGIRRDRFRAGE